MIVFQDIQDVEEWLEPLDYVAFWEAVAPYNLALQDREHCDELITSGSVAQSLILTVLKSMAVMELHVAFGLKDRVAEPLAAQTMASVH